MPSAVSAFVHLDDAGLTAALQLCPGAGQGLWDNPWTYPEHRVTQAVRVMLRTAPIETLRRPTPPALLWSAPGADTAVADLADEDPQLLQVLADNAPTLLAVLPDAPRPRRSQRSYVDRPHLLDVALDVVDGLVTPVDGIGEADDYIASLDLGLLAVAAGHTDLEEVLTVDIAKVLVGQVQARSSLLALLDCRPDLHGQVLALAGRMRTQRDVTTARAGDAIVGLVEQCRSRAAPVVLGTQPQARRGLVLTWPAWERVLARKADCRVARSWRHPSHDLQQALARTSAASFDGSDPLELSPLTLFEAHYDAPDMLPAALHALSAELRRRLDGDVAAWQALMLLDATHVNSTYTELVAAALATR